MDFSKAFDALDHKMLLSKRQYYGVTWTAINWFNNYLYNIEQYVEINGISSDIKILTPAYPRAQF